MGKIIGYLVAAYVGYRWGSMDPEQRANIVKMIGSKIGMVPVAQLPATPMLEAGSYEVPIIQDQNMNVVKSES